VCVCMGVGVGACVCGCAYACACVCVHLASLLLKTKVQCLSVKLFGSQESGKQSAQSTCSQQARNGHCTSWCIAEDPRKCSVECQSCLGEQFSKKLHAAIQEATQPVRFDRAHFEWAHN